MEEYKGGNSVHSSFPPPFCLSVLPQIPAADLPLDKMAAILADDVLYFDLNFTEVCSSGPIDNKATLVQDVAWRRTGDKPLPELMLPQFAQAYMRH